MGLFNFGKKKEDGWDEDAAAEFHNKAPAAPENTVQNAESAEETQDGESSANRKSPPKDGDRDADASASAKTSVPPSVVFAKPVSKAPAAPDTSDDTPDTPPTDTAEPADAAVAPTENSPKVPLDHDSMQQFIAGYTREADEVVLASKGLADFLSNLLPVARDLNDELVEYQKESVGLTENLAYLKDELDALEEKPRAINMTFRRLVDKLNTELAKDYVEGVERIEVPRYNTAEVLVETLVTTRRQFSNMLPALEKSKEGALKMLQTLKPESKAFSPTQELVEFSHNGIECVNQFISQLNELAGELDGAIAGYSKKSDDYWQILTTSEENRAKNAELAASIKGITEAFHESGDRLRKLLSS